MDSHQWRHRDSFDGDDDGQRSDIVLVTARPVDRPTRGCRSHGPPRVTYHQEHRLAPSKTHAARLGRNPKRLGPLGGQPSPSPTTTKTTGIRLDLSSQATPARRHLYPQSRANLQNLKTSPPQQPGCPRRSGFMDRRPAWGTTTSSRLATGRPIRLPVTQHLGTSNIAALWRQKTSSCRFKGILVQWRAPWGK